MSVHDLHLKKKNAEIPRASQGQDGPVPLPFFFLSSGSTRPRVQIRQFAKHKWNSCQTNPGIFFSMLSICHRWISNFIFKQNANVTSKSSSINFFFQYIICRFWSINTRENINPEEYIWIQSKHILSCAMVEKVLYTCRVYLKSIYFSIFGRHKGDWTTSCCEIRFDSACLFLQVSKLFLS